MHSAIAYHLLANAQPDPKQQLQYLVNSPQFIYWAWCHMVWNIPLASLGQLPPNFLCTCSVGRAWEAEKVLEYEYYLATTENINMLSTLFSY